VKARLVTATLNDEGRREIRRAAPRLAEGALVAFPTETVYGIGCNADDPAAVERLVAVKRRPPEKAFTIHIGRRKDAEQHAADLPPAATKLMERYWPGPLTLVVPGKDGQTVGLRMPSNAVALELLQHTPAPVIAPSANRSGEPPATTAQEVAETLGEDLDIILDGGPAPLGTASTVVRVDPDGDWTVLREGAIAGAALRRTLGKTIVFVCTANMCRSPMAEVLCKSLLAERLGCRASELPERGIEVLSAGVYAMADGPASDGAVHAMRELGLDLSGHRSQPLTPGLLDDADLVVVMTEDHAQSIRQLFPEADAKVRLLDPTGADVRDPVGGSPEMFRQCANTIRRHLQEVINSL
jgi:protein-tyrosine phosphatase